MRSPLTPSMLLVVCILIGVLDRSIPHTNAQFGIVGDFAEAVTNGASQVVENVADSLSNSDQPSKQDIRRSETDTNNDKERVPDTETGAKQLGRSSNSLYNSLNLGSSQALLVQFHSQSKKASTSLATVSDKAKTLVKDVGAKTEQLLEDLVRPVSKQAAPLLEMAQKILQSLISESLLFRGQIMVPHAGFNESFTFRFDPTTFSVRFDFHDGATSTYMIPLKDSAVQLIEVRQERWEGRLQTRCAEAQSELGTATDLLLSVLPDISQFSLPSVIEGLGDLPESLLHSVAGGVGQLGAAPGESLTFHQEVLLKESILGVPLPYKVSMSIDSSVLGPGTDGFELLYDELLLQSHDPSVFKPDLSACDKREYLNAESLVDLARLKPLQEFLKFQRDPRYSKLLSDYKTLYEREYIDNLEEAIRTNVFVQRSRFVESVNRRGALFLAGINFLAERLESEVAVLRGTGGEDVRGAPSSSIPAVARSKRSASDKSFANGLDWRKKNAVTPVKMQGNCSSCWAFAVVGTIESALYLRTKKLQPLSEQALVDCGHLAKAHGCERTWPDFAYEYVKQYGVPTEQVYGPYNAKVMTCRLMNTTNLTHVQKHTDVERNNPDALMEALRKLPVVVVMDCSPQTIITYTHGVLEEVNCGTKTNDLNHAMIAVGWGETEEGKPFWIVKNSWGEKWGINGYIHVLASGNTCGVLSRASQPLL